MIQLSAAQPQNFETCTIGVTSFLGSQKPSKQKLAKIAALHTTTFLKIMTEIEKIIGNIEKREITFRAWNEEENIMHDIAFPSWNGTCEVWENNIPQSKIQYLHVNGPECRGILMQFSGKKDKNGKEMYAGDLVKCRTYSGVRVLLFGNNPNTISNMPTFYFDDVIDGFIFREKDCEIAGNIFENPSLFLES